MCVSPYQQLFKQHALVSLHLNSVLQYIQIVQQYLFQNALNRALTQAVAVLKTMINYFNI